MSILLNLICIFSYLKLICSTPINLSNFSTIEIKKGTTEYSYQYSISSYDNSKIPYIFIKLTDKEKIDLKVYFNGIEAKFSEPKGDEWINIPLENEKNNTEIRLKIKTEEINSKMIFIDSSKILKMTLTDFFNLNFNTNKLYKKPIPLLFDITLDKNTYFSIEEEKNYPILEDENILTICNIKENNNCEIIGINNAKLIKDKKYRFKLNCYTDKNIYIFQKLKILYYMEEIYFKNNTFTINNFSQNNFLLLNIHNRKKHSFYISKDSESLHEDYEVISLKKDNLFTFLNNINNTSLEKFKEVENGEIIRMINYDFDDYLIIRLNNKIRKKEGSILFFSEEYDIFNLNYWEKEIKNGSHALIFISINNEFKGILASNRKNMKYSMTDKYFINKVLIIDTFNRWYTIYVDSSKEYTKLCFNYFKEFDNFYNYKVVLDNDLKNFLNNDKEDNIFL